MKVSERQSETTEARFAQAKMWADRELDRLLPRAADEPRTLHEALRYAVFSGGKRLRPALVHWIGLHFGASAETCALPAAAIECLHTYSLVHDDLPCMDDDDLRRGRPTCHKVYGEATAVLVGDALQTHAFLLLSGALPAHVPSLVSCLAEAAGSRGMVGGQALDLVLGDEGRVSPADVERVHGWKTAALIAAACEMGAIVADQGASERQRAAQYGRVLGLCFQAVDDVLDVTGDALTLGKTPGKDEKALKPTIVAALGLDGARREARRLADEARVAAERLGAQQGEILYELPGELLVRSA
ncbi:MAG: farnesyl diphosphate synthase [Planctomycetota bacterium]|nr:farnesyl diphosphate synthase [Planctomycetota bacterium]